MSIKVVDSSCWIEVFANGPLAKKCQKEINSLKSIAVPSLVIYEVYRRIKLSSSDESGLSVTSYLSQFDVKPLTRQVALLAVDLFFQYNLGTADNLILTHTHEISAELITLGNDFRGLPRVRILS
ncbi:MAG: type II toxin-antitoxin system VapC family toxin [Bdellovibrionaceae bacterium]|nr:type II toxin-antitoxin system VapC family toxin [Pseudobdellovibrionaceae bacterium]